MNRGRRALLLGLLAPAVARADDLVVHVARRDGRVVMDVQARIPAPAPVVWAVLTDYEHMAAFLSAVKSSAVTQRDSEHALQVAQTVESHVGPFTFRASSVKRVELQPTVRLHSTLVSGDFDSYDSTTTLAERDGATLLVNHSEYAPRAWVPPGLGPSVIETETRSQYQQLLAEILRRVAR